MRDIPSYKWVIISKAETHRENIIGSIGPNPKECVSAGRGKSVALGKKEEQKKRAK